MSDSLNPESPEIKVVPSSNVAESTVVASAPLPAVSAPVPSAPVELTCRACGYEQFNGAFTVSGVTYFQCANCESYSALSPATPKLGEPHEFLARKEDIDRLVQPILVWYSEDGSFVKYLKDQGYAADGYEPRDPKAKIPKPKYATVILCDGLEYEPDVAAALKLTSQSLTDSGQIQGFNLAHPETGTAVLLTSQGLALAAKRAGLHVVSQDFARAIILGV
jgi:hypothetical protein